MIIEREIKLLRESIYISEKQESWETRRRNPNPFRLGSGEKR